MMMEGPIELNNKSVFVERSGDNNGNADTHSKGRVKSVAVPARGLPAATVRDLLTYHVDVTSPPDVDVLRVLADGCEDQLDVTRLQALIQVCFQCLQR
jgi:hypothetical protein